jgi:hypothetical protein
MAIDFIKLRRLLCNLYPAEVIEDSCRKRAYFVITDYKTVNL